MAVKSGDGGDLERLFVPIGDSHAVQHSNGKLLCHGSNAQRRDGDKVGCQSAVLGSEVQRAKRQDCGTEINNSMLRFTPTCLGSIEPSDLSFDGVSSLCELQSPAR